MYFNLGSLSTYRPHVHLVSGCSIAPSLCVELCRMTSALHAGATCNTVTVTIIVEDSNDNQPVFPETDFGNNRAIAPQSFNT